MLNFPNDTNVFVAKSTDGGLTWTVPTTPVNNDIATDASNQTEGRRSQFMPTLAVDPVTGTLVVTYYDARNDAARIARRR